MPEASDLSHLLTPQILIPALAMGHTPFYLYSEEIINQQCDSLKAMPSAHGLNVRYAMKAQSTRAILETVALKNGLDIDASSMNEVRRASLAGIAYGKIMLTTQEVPQGKDRTDLENMMRQGLKYNVCSLEQLGLIADFASSQKIPLSMGVHPGVGSGESSTRNTGDKYSCFRIHLTDLEKALRFAKGRGLVFDQVHVHIGSGGDPEKWRENIDRELGFVEKYFLNSPNSQPISKVSFGGGLKVARMPGEDSADIQDLGDYAAKRLREFSKRTGRELIMEIEPGNYVVANSGFLVTKVIDKKRTGPNGFEFLVLDGGMEVNSRPLLYGSRHPFYTFGSDGFLKSSEFDLGGLDPINDQRVVVGRCCESGDSQSLDKGHNIVPRVIANLEIGDYVVIGAVGAYCSTMTPINYNSHTQAPEILVGTDSRLDLIRGSQSLDQVIQNERSIF
jgi:diaminopimelate decarboxylase